MEKMILDKQFGYYNTDTWEFIPVDKMESGEFYFLNTPEHLEKAKLVHEINEEFKQRLFWGKSKDKV